MNRKQLQHTPPAGIQEDAIFFITINCRPRGKNQLAIKETAEKIFESVRLRKQMNDWWPELILLMPDHLNGFIRFSPQKSMNSIISNWKRYTARFYGIQWQRGFFDHRIRSDDSLASKWEYILNNPVNAGLTEMPEKWPFVWTAEDF